ncbi:MAG: hypothetical protein M0R22_00425 [Dehalococcoidia bacterium]|jgi:hypothetical protein|nr:hypothetical protein [Dehalococcoidia bacterium]
MNPFAVVLLIGAGVVGLTMLARKSNAAADWVRRYWNHFVQLPTGFRLSGWHAHILVTAGGERDPDYDVQDGEIFFDIPISAEIHAPSDALVTRIWNAGNEPNDASTGIYLSHLDERGSSSFTILQGGSGPRGGWLVGIGQFVHAGEVIGNTYVAEVAFSVYSSVAVPQELSEVEETTLDPVTWTSNRNIELLVFA